MCSLLRPGQRRQGRGSEGLWHTSPWAADLAARCEKAPGRKGGREQEGAPKRLGQQWPGPALEFPNFITRRRSAQG